MKYVLVFLLLTCVVSGLVIETEQQAIERIRKTRGDGVTVIGFLGAYDCREMEGGEWYCDPAVDLCNCLLHLE